MQRRTGLAAWVKQAPPAEICANAGPYACAVAIPARDEADLIERCLQALAAQQNAPDFAVVLFLNNCRDKTAELVARAAPALPFALQVYESDLPPELSDAAWARRLTLNAATALVCEDGAVLSTDADSYAACGWIGDCLADIDAGADIVCGFVAPDFSDAPALDFETLRHGAMEYEYSQLAAELTLLIDPEPFDPWPRHLMETGANLAVRAAVLRALGGIPHVCPGEDQAFVRLAQRHGHVVRHDFRPHVTTSSRLKGRASGGWSEDLKMRADNRRDICHEKLEPASAVLRRALLRAGLRRLFGTHEFQQRAARLVAEPAEAQRIQHARTFGEAWARIEDASPLLRRKPLRREALEADIARLRAHVEARRRPLTPAMAPQA
jgi:hypothetical protein